ncbi:hypothetical protein G647_07569 [Cladophialophora carrionii CBS 160.54]|uniref:Extracellular membrane protein CFEM domain-containing protein n=1 Tax=Cladophialophora carrionii CBS 160.54 TaxID=1279043 RepID=V9D2R7_9EURO|nr:uncharacterized protein G647_07569 [Cladophialophora carrionii CBS 160.54]ETI21224.1 hypothetical protein G647_07569 [Cladophialophora carrionii CBS 160.54]
MELRSHARLSLALLLYAIVQTSSASASFPSIQPIVGFSTPCTLAYDTPVNLCDNDDFQGIGGKGSCSAACQANLVASQGFVQRLCAGQQADGNSIIGHLFSGDIVDFLCGDNTDAASTTATTAQTTLPSSSVQSTMSMAVDTMPPDTSTGVTPSSSTTTTTATSSSRTGSGSGTILTTTSTRPASSTSSSVPASVESETSSLAPASSSSETSSTSSSASATSTSNSQGSAGGSGGGSPFDSTFSGSASSPLMQVKLLSLSCLVALVLAVS